MGNDAFKKSVKKIVKLTHSEISTSEFSKSVPMPKIISVVSKQLNVSRDAILSIQNSKTKNIPLFC